MNNRSHGFCFSGIPFAKMSGCGNDFIVIDNRGKIIPPESEKEFVVCSCNRRFGIGADGVLLLEESAKDEQSRSSRAAYRMRYFNSDGGEVEFCGNGARCLALFAHKRGLTGSSFYFQSSAGIHEARISGDDVVVEMPEPGGIALDQMLDDGQEYDFVTAGVPHMVVLTSDVESVDVVSFGSKYRHSTKFAPHGTNVTFAQIGTSNILIRTYERGVEDETPACGSGAVAAAVVAFLKQKITSPVEVRTKSGYNLQVWIKKTVENRLSVLLAGDTTLVFTGNINKLT